jgi:DNA/RNA-binding domain of Phe-tRNA-synthetase-like protein
MAVFAAVPAFVRVSIRLAGFTDDHRAAVAALLVRAGERAALTDDDVRVSSWREAYVQVGLGEDVVPPHVALAAWATVPGGVPPQGTLPDLVNAFGLLHGVPVATYDPSGAMGDLWLRPARGTETFEPLGGEALGPSAVGSLCGGTPAMPTVGELILSDSADHVLARHWHGAQGRATVLRGGASEALVHLDLLPPLAADAETLAGRFVRLVTGFVGGTSDVRLISRSRPQAPWTA